MKFLITTFFLLSFSFLFADANKGENINYLPPKNSEAKEKSELEKGIVAYSKGDFADAKKYFLAHKRGENAETSFAYFMLSNIAVRLGDLDLAKEYFPLAFENLSENNELFLAQNFAAFADANNLYQFELQYLEPFYKTHGDIFDKDSMLYFYYAKALFETGKKDESKNILLVIWKKFKDSPSDDACDSILFNDKLKACISPDIKDAESAIAKARKNALQGNLKDFVLPENPSVGLCLWALQNQNKAKIEDIENALDANPNSLFIWMAWTVLSETMYKEGNYELARSFSMRGIHFIPDDINETYKIYMILGDSNRALKSFEDAKEAYQKIYMDANVHGEYAAEALYKTGLAAYDAKDWNSAYIYFRQVFLAYAGFDHWSSRAYFYAAHARINDGDNLGARNILRLYLKTSKHRDTKIFKDSLELYNLTPVK